MRLQQVLFKVLTHCYRTNEITMKLMHFHIPHKNLSHHLKNGNEEIMLFSFSNYKDG